MRKLFMILIFCLAACDLCSTEEKKAESLVRPRLQNFNRSSDDYKIIDFKSLHPIYTTFEDDSNYDKYKKAPAKIDSIKKNYKPFITGWVVYVKYKGKDEYGNVGIHTYQCGLDSKLSKVVVMIEVDGFSI
jgi:hypothetical protein